MEIDQLFQDYMAAQKLPQEPHNLYRPISYLMNLPAKRVRPTLCLLTCRLFQADATPALPQAYAVELFHNFTLMHDDIMDAAPLRRGHDSVHAKFGLNSAILSGDVMLIHCYPYLMKGLDQERALQTVELFSDTAVGICHGQQLDLDFEQLETLSTEQYLQMIQLKTAILLGCSMALGGIAAGEQEDTIDTLYEIGVGMGIAFQIQDDYLDIFGSTQKTGKQRGGDVIQGKKTLPYIKAMEIGGHRVVSELKGIYQNKEAEAEIRVSRASEIFRSLGVDHQLRSMKEAHYRGALGLLRSLSCRDDERLQLEQLFNSLLDRDH